MRRVDAGPDATHFKARIESCIHPVHQRQREILPALLSCYKSVISGGCWDVLHYISPSKQVCIFPFSFLCLLTHLICSVYDSILWTLFPAFAFQITSLKGNKMCSSHLLSVWVCRQFLAHLGNLGEQSSNYLMQHNKRSFGSSVGTKGCGSEECCINRYSDVTPYRSLQESRWDDLIINKKKRKTLSLGWSLTKVTIESALPWVDYVAMVSTRLDEAQICRIIGINNDGISHQWNWTSTWLPAECYQ